MEPETTQQVQTGVEEGESASLTAASPPRMIGAYPHPERDVEVFSRTHLIALCFIVALLALHIQFNRNWPGYYRLRRRTVSTLCAELFERLIL